MEKDSGKKNPITRDEAIARKGYLSNQEGSSIVNYNLLISLRRSADPSAHHDKTNYGSQIEIKFYVGNVPSNDQLFLDFIGQVISLNLNGENVENIVAANHRIYLETKRLKMNSENTVNILYNAVFSKISQGLHYYLDPSDNNEYMYTQFEPFDCHKMFPCFDQPDLKARLTLSLITPDEWVALGNEKEKWVRKLDLETEKIFDDSSFPNKLTSQQKSYLFSNDLISKGYSLHHFDTTPKISTYLFAIAAGPYHIVNNPTDYPVSLRIFTRQSLKTFGDPQEFFRCTMAGMEWYRDFFGIAYPFSKYDQIYCPEYNWGAMENVGLVTYNELYLWREPPNSIRRSRFCITVLHELAHMWFGNLVTMKWWNDLWLNESFATFISFLCQYEALKDSYHDAWISFNSSKSSAYRSDQQSTTHPVMCDVKNTEVAETHFDALVYYKGSSFLKQLFYFIGRENFSKGLKSYFKTFSWRNTIFDDFIGKMVEACGHDFKFNLVEISESWLKRAGLNQLEVKYEVNNEGNISSFNIIQTACLESHNNLQTHLIDILAVYGTENKVFSHVTVNPHESTSVDSLLGTKKADAYILNYDDWGYFKWIIDRESLDYFKNPVNFNRLPNTLAKSLFYQSIFNLTRDSKLSSLEYIDTIKALIVHETDDHIISTTLSTLSGIVSSYVPLEYYAKYSKIIADLVLVLLQNEGLSNDSTKTLLQTLISYSTSEDQISFLKSWLNEGPFIVLKNDTKKAFNADFLTQDMRFSIVAIIHKSTVISNDEKAKLLEIEIERDKNSDRSVRARFYCEAAKPDPELKKKLWNKYINESNSESLHNMSSSMSLFAPRDQIAITQEYLTNSFFTDVVTVAKNNEHFYLENFLAYCSPRSFINEEIISKLEKLAEDNKSIDTLRLKVLEIIDDMRRFLKAHKLCHVYEDSHK